jgi:quercetin dioxygenase-like cupin family protein
VNCDHVERLSELALGLLPQEQADPLERHAAGCSVCSAELDSLRATVDSFVAWPTDVLRPATPVWGRIAERIAAETGREPALDEPEAWDEPEWAEVAPGISCKLLATDAEKHVVSMLVRLAPGTDYPPHTHAGTEELHLLDGELWIDDRKLYPGDFNRAEPGTSDARVWSETGCTCVLVTSTRDVLR